MRKIKGKGKQGRKFRGRAQKRQDIYSSSTTPFPSFPLMDNAAIFNALFSRASMLAVVIKT